MTFRSEDIQRFIDNAGTPDPDPFEGLDEMMAELGIDLSAPRVAPAGSVVEPAGPVDHAGPVDPAGPVDSPHLPALLRRSPGGQAGDLPDGPTLLGRYVRRSRSFVGISQQTLATRCGASQSAVARLELGRAGGMKIGRLIVIGAELGRALPLGFCPHTHRCIWQPFEPPAPPSEQDLIREKLVEHGLDTPYPWWKRI